MWIVINILFLAIPISTAMILIPFGMLSYFVLGHPLYGLIYIAMVVSVSYAILKYKELTLNKLILVLMIVLLAFYQLPPVIRQVMQELNQSTI